MLLTGCYVQTVPYNSSAVETRLSNACVRTVSGNLYYLLGSPDKMEMQRLWIGTPVLQAFAEGFPEDWITVLEQSHATATGRQQEIGTNVF